MAATRVGYEILYNAGISSVPVSNPAGAQAGDRLVLVVTVATASTTITDTAGWTLLADRTYNTRRTFVLWREWAASYAALTLSGFDEAGSVVMAVRADAGHALEAPVLGALWDRPSNGGSINFTTMPSLSAPADSLVLGVTSEVSSAAESEAQVSVAGSGWAKWFYADTNEANNASPNFIVVHKVLASAGASGDATSTWPNNSNNSMGVQVLVAQESAEPPSSGMVGAHGCFSFDSDRLTIGHDRLGGTVHETVLYAGAFEVDRQTVTPDGTTGWGCAEFIGLTPGTVHVARFEVDGVEQTDAEVIVSTLPASPPTFSVVAGSCQFTGSTHPVFDAMLAESPLFIGHMGDLHYADATDEPTWRGAMESSLTGMQGLLEHVPMSWAPDNHDLIRTSPLGGGDPVGMAAWKKMAGAAGWASADSLGRAWRVGRVQFIHTDMRTARDNYQTDPEPRTFLGAAQKAWFKDLLTSLESDDTVACIVWFTTWTARNDENGRWNSYPSESSELEAHINALPSVKARMVMVGGDSHVLQADSGARTGIGFRFHGIPSLNMSGFNRSSIYATGGWDIAEDNLRAEAQSEADWGGYSRLTFTDDAGELVLRWEAIRVGPDGATDTMSTFTRTYGVTGPTLRLGAKPVIATMLGTTPVSLA